MGKIAARALPMVLLAVGCVAEPPEGLDYQTLMGSNGATPQPPASLPALPGATTATGAIPWLNGTIPYVLPSSLSPANAAIFLAACQEWKDAAGITCQPRQNEPVYLTINPFAQACQSGVGSLDPMWPGVVTLDLGPGCWSFTTVLHELGHAIGLEHEHQRTDRDSYLNIRNDLVQVGFRPNISALPGAAMRIGQPYDYLSIMHYSANQGGSTISTLIMLPWDNTNHTDIVMGFGRRVSEGDTAKVLALYAQYHLQPSGRREPTINPAPITVVSQQGATTVIQITGQFLPSGNGVVVNWHDTNYNTFESRANIVAESATQIQFSVPTLDGTTVPTNLYADTTSARMPVWIRVFNASARDGSEGAPVPANFPTTLGVATAGTHLEPGPIAPSPVLNAASFEQASRVAPGSWATLAGTNLAATATIAQPSGLVFPTSLGGTTVTLGGLACPLLYVGPTQINFYIPDGARLGPNQLVVSTNGTITKTASVRIYGVSPGLFTATQNGTGWVVGQAIWNDAGAQKTAPLTTGSGATAQAVPLDLAAAHNLLYLSLYATGVRGRSDQRNAFLLIDGLVAPITYADTQHDYVGLDQINVSVPAALAGRGKVKAFLVVDGVVAPPVELFFK